MQSCNLSDTFRQRWIWTLGQDWWCATKQALEHRLNSSTANVVSIAYNIHHCVCDGHVIDIQALNKMIILHPKFGFWKKIFGEQKAFVASIYIMNTDEDECAKSLHMWRDGDEKHTHTHTHTNALNEYNRSQNLRYYTEPDTSSKRHQRSILWRLLEDFPQKNLKCNKCSVTWSMCKFTYGAGRRLWATERNMG